MPLLKARGVYRRVGTIVQPSEAGQLWLAAQGFLHDVFARLAPEAHAAGAFTAPPTLDLVTPCADIVGLMLANGADPLTTLVPCGDCVVAEDMKLAAMRARLAAGAGSPTTWCPTASQTVGAYSAATGYVEGDASTDNGTDPVAYIQWRLAGNLYPDGSRLVAAYNVDATNWAAYQQAQWLADGVMHWANLPDATSDEEDAGDTWDASGPPVAANGHGFGGCGYSATEAYALTWGLNPPIKMTRAFLAQYCVPSAGGGCVALVGSNAFSRITQLCPAGVDLSGLEAALGAVGAVVS